MRIFLVYLKQYRLGIGLFFMFCAVFAAAFYLYSLPLGAVLYPAAICLAVGATALLIKARILRKKHRALLEMMQRPAALMEGFPEAVTVDDLDYQAIIEKLRGEQRTLENNMNARYTDMLEYYTVWAHQIKTPIASMRLTLQNEDSDAARRASEDLFRIEQYVEMVLMFLRLDADSTDYVIRSYDLDAILKQAVRKFSTQFIYKKLRLSYEGVHTSVVTDEKWLLFVVEQVLSNAVKYTPAGGEITITLESPKTLCIRDTGCGIAPEDLPRIFEKGYTGLNGRADKSASGIGLYLCRRILNNLGHSISAQSEVGKGTVISIDLAQNTLEVE